MPREVWKFQVPIGIGTDRVEMPTDAQIIDVGTQEAHVFVWALVDPAEPLRSRRLAYFATGSPVPDGWEYIGSAHVIGRDPLGGSAYVFHVFEDPP
jgi:hypothetical protein